MSQEKRDYVLLKLCGLGLSERKTALIKRYNNPERHFETGWEFAPGPEGWDLTSSKVKLNETEIRLILFYATSSPEAPLLCKSASGVILFFDLDNVESFEFIEELFPEIIKYTN